MQNIDIDNMILYKYNNIDNRLYFLKVTKEIIRKIYNK